jgi:hypothetical protein
MLRKYNENDESSKIKFKQRQDGMKVSQKIRMGDEAEEGQRIWPLINSKSPSIGYCLGCCGCAGATAGQCCASG